MPGVFDRLQKEIDAKRKESGISVLDLADLPPALRKIMQLMLRRIQMSSAQLHEANDSLPEGERLTPASLNQSLKKLSDQAWLIQIGEGDRAIYKVNLRRRAGSHLSETIWQNLDSKLKS